MYDVQRTEYGLRIEISGNFDHETADEFVDVVQSEVRELEEGFSVLADLREIAGFSPEVGERIAELMSFSSRQGMSRSANVVESATTTLQMERLVEQAGTDERVIDATDTDDWESAALRWITDGIEPEEQ